MYFICKKDALGSRKGAPFVTLHHERGRLIRWHCVSRTCIPCGSREGHLNLQLRVSAPTLAIGGFCRTRNVYVDHHAYRRIMLFCFHDFLNSFSQTQDLEKHKCPKKFQEGIPCGKTNQTDLPQGGILDSDSKILSTTGGDPAALWLVRTKGLKGPHEGKCMKCQASETWRENLRSWERSRLGTWQGQTKTGARGSNRAEEGFRRAPGCRAQKATGVMREVRSAHVFHETCQFLVLKEMKSSNCFGSWSSAYSTVHEGFLLRNTTPVRPRPWGMSPTPTWFHLFVLCQWRSHLSLAQTRLPRSAHTTCPWLLHGIPKLYIRATLVSSLNLPLCRNSLHFLSFRVLL